MLCVSRSMTQVPELPEVQTVVNDLQILTGDTITGFWTDFEKGIKTNKIANKIVGEKILKITRLSKNIVIELSNKTFILIHLKMTGKLIISDRSSVIDQQTKNKHLHHAFYFKKNKKLEFHDIRKFATIELVNKTKLSEIETTKGIDPFNKNFTLQNFISIINRKKNKSIKSILMDQSLISGIGNIYASEIPYDAKLNPLRKIHTLNKKEMESLYKSVLKILTKAIKLRGTSISDYRDAKGKKGSFQNHLKVYGKAGKKCTKCDTIIIKNIVEQRSTFHCPTCQN